MHFKPFGKGGGIMLKKLADAIGAPLPASLDGGTVCGRVLTQAEYVRDGDAVISAGWYGHEKTVSQSLQNGAAVVFCPQGVKDCLYPDDDRVIAAADPLECVKRFELRCSEKCRAKRIAVTGSVGKTTTTGLIGEIMSYERGTLTHPSMSNSHGAILRNFQKLTPRHKWWVQEVGGVQPGYIESSACVLRPDIAVITNIGQSHLDKYETKENILYDKLSLERHMTKGGTVIINGDDELLAAAEYTHKTLRISARDASADYYIKSVRSTHYGTEFDFSCAEGNFTARLALFGEYNAYNGAMAVAVGRLAGVPMKKCIELMARYRPAGMRQNYRNIGGYHMLIDCFNAEPQTVLGSAKTLAQMPVPNGGRRIFVTGHIDKLGGDSKRLHYELGESLAQLGLDIIVLFGGDSDRIYAALKAHGFENALLMKSRTELEDWIRQNITRSDVTFYKSGQFETAMAKSIDRVYGTALRNEEQFNIGTVVQDGCLEFKIRRDGIAELTRCRGREKNIVIPAQCGGATVVRIQSRAFKGSYAESVTIPDTVTHIGRLAFFNCTRLRELHLPKSLKFIDDNAFNNCRRLESLSIPDGTLHIGRRAFYDCRALRKLHIPDSVGFIGEDAFASVPGFDAQKTP